MYHTRKYQRKYHMCITSHHCELQENIKVYREYSVKCILFFKLKFKYIKGNVLGFLSLV